MLGVAYKKDIDDPRESPAFEVIERLLNPRRSSPTTIPTSAGRRECAPGRICHRWRRSRSPRSARDSRDAVVIVTDHSAVDYDLVRAHAPLIIDTRGVYRQPRPTSSRREGRAAVTDALRGALALVTGGAGFIGSHLVDALLDRGVRVRVLDDLSSGSLENLAGAHSRIEFLHDDIRDPGACRRACGGVTWVFHQAARGSVPRSMADPATSIAINVSGTVNVFAAARDEKVTRVIYASSSSVYGDSPKLPKREGRGGTTAITVCALESGQRAARRRVWTVLRDAVRGASVLQRLRSPPGPG